jgi:hypothetical protein
MDGAGNAWGIAGRLMLEHHAIDMASYFFFLILFFHIIFLATIGWDATMIGHEVGVVFVDGLDGAYTPLVRNV